MYVIVPGAGMVELQSTAQLIPGAGILQETSATTTATWAVTLSTIALETIALLTVQCVPEIYSANAS